MSQRLDGDIAQNENIKKKSAGFPGTSVVKNPSADAGDRGSNPWSGKIPQASEPLSPCATATEPVLKSLGAKTTEPVLCNKRNHCDEKPAHLT